VKAPSRQLARKPPGLSHAEAAALPLAGLTAWQSLVDTAGLAAGQRVLIHGAGGGVGHLAVQIAKARGAYVVGTASAAKHEFVRSLGADELIDHQTCDFAAVAGDMDVVLDSLGGEIARRSIGVLRPGGMLVTIVGRRDVELAARTRAGGRRFAGLSVEPDYPGLEAVAGTGRFRAAPGPSPDDAAPFRGGQGPPAPGVRPHHRQDRADRLAWSARPGGRPDLDIGKRVMVLS